MNVSPLLERDADLSVIGSAVDQLSRGKGGVVVVEGPAGIGKTRVVDSVVAGTGARVLVARCTPLSPTLTAGVVRDWLRPVLREIGPGNPPFDGLAARLLDPALSLGDLIWAVSWVLDDFVAHGPLLLVVDDLHWADPASLAIIDHLAAGLAERPVLLVLALRSGEPTVGDLHVERLRASATRLRLKPLSPDAAATLVDDLPADLAASVVRRSAGNPLFLTELAESARRGEGDVPGNVVDVVVRLLDRMAPEARAVASAAAVLGGFVDRETVRAVAGVGAPQLSEAVDVLTRAHLLRADLTHAGPVHPLVGDAIERALPVAVRDQLHRTAAREMLRLGADPREVAPHLLRTAPAGDPEVRSVLTDVGEKALAVQSFPAAVDYLSRAVTEDDHPPSALLASTARALAATGDLDRAVALWRRARTAEPDVEAAALTMAEAGDALLAAGRLEDAARVWEDELGRLEVGSEAAKAIAVRISLGTAVIRGFPRHFTEPLASLATQDPELDTHGDRLILAAASVGGVFSGESTAAQVRALAERSWGSGRLLAEETAAGSPLYLTTAACNWTDSFDLGTEILDAAMDQARTMSSDVLGTAAYCRGYVRCRQGATRAAIDDIELALTMRELGWDAYTAALLQVAIESYLRVGDLAAAERMAVELATTVLDGHVFVEAYRSLGLAQIALARGAVDDGLAALASTGTNAWAISPAMVDWRGTWVRLQLAAGRADLALDAADELVDLARRFGAPRLLASALTTRSLVDPSSTELLREAVELLEPAEVHGTFERVEAALLLSERTRGTESVTLAQAAHARAAEEGLLPSETRALAVLRERGGAPLRETTPWDLLSPAERRVVEVVLAGMTNREAAEHLFLSVKGVEWQLSSTYRKLGIRGRSALGVALGPRPRPTQPRSDQRH